MLNAFNLHLNFASIYAHTNIFKHKSIKITFNYHWHLNNSNMHLKWLGSDWIVCAGAFVQHRNKKNQIKYEIKMCRMPTHPCQRNKFMTLYIDYIIQLFIDRYIRHFCCNGDFISQCDLFDLREHLKLFGIWFMAFVHHHTMHNFNGMMQVNKQIYKLKHMLCSFFTLSLSLHFISINTYYYSVGVNNSFFTLANAMK